MFYVAIFGPVTVAYVLGWPYLILLGLMGIEIGFLVGVGTETGTPGTGDILSAVLATVLVAVSFGILGYMTLYRDLEAYFSCTPWIGQGRELVIKGGTRRYQTRCPFTGLRPTMRCPSCDCRIHDVAMHKPDRWIGFLGDTVLRWDAVKAALAGTGSVAKVRSAVDRALDFRGNYLLCGVSECCSGCAAWQRNFNLAPRLALMNSMAALLLAYLGWAFAAFSDTIDVAGAAIQGVAGGAAVYYASSAALVQLQALLRANAFLSAHAASIPAMQPLFALPRTRVLAAVHDAFCSTPWSPS